MAKKKEEEQVIISQEENQEVKPIDNLPKVKNINAPKQEPAQVGHTTRAFRSKQQ